MVKADALLELEHRFAVLHWMDWRGRSSRMRCAQQVFCGWFLNLLLGKIEPLRYSSVQGSKFFQIPLRNKRECFEPVARRKRRVSCSGEAGSRESVGRTVLDKMNDWLID